MDGSSLSAMEWKKMYLQMEGKLRQFRVQATAIRTKLSQKMEELTVKFEQAEGRAADADYQLALLRDSIAGVPGASEEAEEFHQQKIVELEKRCLEQQERILALEKELEYEHYLRKLDKGSLHEKALKIKEWVSKTLSSAEKEKEELRDSNTRLSAAVQSMQRRLTELLDQSSTSSIPHSSASQHQPDTSLQSVSKSPITVQEKAPTSRISSPTSPSWQTSPLFDNKVHSDMEESVADGQQSTRASMELEHCDTQSDENLSAKNDTSKKDVTDNLSENTTVKKSSQIFSLKAEDKYVKVAPLSRFMPGKSRSTAVKSAADTDMLNVGKDEDVKEVNKSSTLPMTKPVASSTKSYTSPTSSSSPQTHHHFMGTFGSIRRKFKGLTDHHQKGRTHDDTPTSSRGRDKRVKQRSKSKSPGPRSSSFTRQKTSPIAVPGANPDASSSPLPAILQEEETMVTDQNFSKSSPTSVLSSSLPVTGWRVQQGGRPPTPPMHRLPSWESKLYDVAKNGFKISAGAVSKSAPHKNTALLNMEREPDEFAELVYKQHPLTIPVYTKIKGRAAQIRRIPFTDASDSSDDDNFSHPSSPLRQLSPRTPHRSSRSLIASADISNVVIHQRRNGSPGIAKALKRANSQQSMGSSEGDYAIPPDAQIGCNSANSDSSEPEHKLFKTSRHQSTSSFTGSRPINPGGYKASFAEESRSAGASSSGGQRCGYLNKLGGRVRTWKKRWCVLKNKNLLYFKSPNDITRKPQGQIALTGVDVKLSRDDTAASTFQLVSGKRTYYLSADSQQAATDWINALQATIGNKKEEITAGWITRTVGGSSCRVWARMLDDTLEYYEREDGVEMPLDRLSLKGCSVEVVQLNVQSPIGASHQYQRTLPAFDHVIVVRRRSESGRDVFLSFETESQKIAWLHKLTLATHSTGSTASPALETYSFDPSAGTEYERLVVKLLQSEKSGSEAKRGKSPASGTLWRNPILSYSKDGITRPLTTLPTDALQTEAIKLAKSIQLFSNVSMDAASADYHITMAQRIAQSCLTHLHLRNEVFSQLIKLTNRRSTEIKSPNDSSYLQGWKLLSLLLPLFLPQGKLLWLLKAHLSRHANPKNEVGQYVLYCRRTVERTSSVGERVAPPSRTEALSILLQNPYHHSLPFSVPVHFADGSYQVVSFDGSTTASEFSNRINVQKGLRHHTTSGFGLFVDDPNMSISAAHYVEPSVKLCDAMSTWERVLRQQAVVSKQSAQSSPGEGDVNRSTARFSFLQRLSFKMYQTLETQKERPLLVYQIADAMSRDRFPLSRELAVEMTSLLAQLHHGNRQDDIHDQSSADNVIRRFYPARYRNKHQTKQLRERILEHWELLHGTASSDCVRIFLNIARKWPLCGSKLFAAKIETSGKYKGDIAWLCVGEDSLSMLNYKTMEVVDKCEYTDLVTFGGCKNQFMVVTEMAGVSRKLFFSLPRVQMLQVVRLMADYINSSSPPDSKMCAMTSL
ncbi:unnamed protein product [Clavelina lepadiformis]|uniref:Uncharacterized protein n=1 Tax=Clavelina lepadiformis TaxID=159417 RepID=A0ABP0GKD8_CLALP